MWSWLLLQFLRTRSHAHVVLLDECRTGNLWNSRVAKMNDFRFSSEFVFLLGVCV